MLIDKNKKDELILRSPQEIYDQWERDKEAYESVYLNRLVRLNDTAYPSRARGRHAIISFVTFDSGVARFCCMVLRAETRPEDHDFLNSSGWTRECRTADEFEFVDELRYLRHRWNS